MSSNERKSTKLGMPLGTAASRLRKSIMFMLAKKTGMDVCHRCGCHIEVVAEFSIEHKNSWELAADPVAAFFDLDNVAFSHLRCNIVAGSRPRKKWSSKKECDAACNIRTQKTRVASTRAWRHRRRAQGLPYS